MNRDERGQEGMAEWKEGELAKALERQRITRWCVPHCKGIIKSPLYDIGDPILQTDLNNNEKDETRSDNVN